MEILEQTTGHALTHLTEVDGVMEKWIVGRNRHGKTDKSRTYQRIPPSRASDTKKCQEYGVGNWCSDAELKAWLKVTSVRLAPTDEEERIAEGVFQLRGDPKDALAA